MVHKALELSETRRQECDAFKALADLLRAHHALWCDRRPESYSLERFCEQVDRLSGTGRFAAQVDEVWDLSAFETHKTSVLLRMLDRMNALVDFVEDPRSGLQHAMELLPSRSMLPTDDEGVVAFCRAVHTSLLPVPGATTVRGGFAARMRNLNASLDIYAAFDGSLGAEEHPTPNVQDHYAQRREKCLHLLLAHVDTHMHKFAAHISFQDAYYTARMALMKLTVQARAAYFRKTGPWV